MPFSNSIELFWQSLGKTKDRCGALHGRLEDLLFRAQRIALAEKRERKNPDHFFHEDLIIFRNDVRESRQEIGELAAEAAAVASSLLQNHGNRKRLEIVSILARQIHASLASLSEYASLAYQRMPERADRIQSWYCLGDINEMIKSAQKMEDSLCAARSGAPLDAAQRHSVFSESRPLPPIPPDSPYKRRL